MPEFDVLILYSDEDSHYAKRLTMALESHGLSILDQYGKDMWGIKIELEVANLPQWIVVLISPHTYRSYKADDVFDRLLKAATEYGVKRVILCGIDGEQTSDFLPYGLRVLQIYRLFSSTGDLDKDELERLLRRLHESEHISERQSSGPGEPSLMLYPYWWLRNGKYIIQFIIIPISLLFLLYGLLTFINVSELANSVSIFFRKHINGLVTSISPMHVIATGLIVCLAGFILSSVRHLFEFIAAWHISKTLSSIVRSSPPKSIT
ncbi:MAG: hypothetical protein QOH49_2696 [Acidobacteriota bacterium]|jgi:hypothetical protein|nr:hypothetical protein [Acidobacteriota bacterium]